MGGGKRSKGKSRGKKKKTKLPTLDISSRAQLPSLSELDSQVSYLESRPVFSFQFYDRRHKKFSAKSVSNCGDFYLLFTHLKKFGNMTWRQIEQSGDYHAHEVTWKDTKQKSGFPERLGETPNQFPPYQFKVFEEFRIFGFHQGNVFQIVWFDRNHEVYS